MIHARKDYNVIQIVQELNGHMLLEIPDDEPVFLIRAKDVLGPSTVDEWANAAQIVGASSEIVAAARKQADAMATYAAEHYAGGKIPDAPKDAL